MIASGGNFADYSYRQPAGAKAEVAKYTMSSAPAAAAGALPNPSQSQDMVYLSDKPGVHALTPGAPLGNYAEIASTLADPVRKTFWLQSLAQDLLPDERVADCLKKLAPVNPEAGAKAYTWQTVEIHYNPHTHKAHYRNLMVCDSVWTCPCCASKISEKRRQELTEACRRVKARGGDYAMVTVTLRHQRADSLRVIRRALLAAIRRMKSGRRWQEIKSDYFIVGDVRGTEMTHGANGWHPHAHFLVFFERPMADLELKSLEIALKTLWGAILAGLGQDASWEHGLDLKAGDQYVRDYVAKFGRLPKLQLDDGWTVQHELTKSNVKLARSPEGRSPWQLLADYGFGDRQAGRLFQEYAREFKGVHQLQWSRGLRAWLGMDEIESEIEAQAESQSEYLTEVDKASWSEIVRRRLRGELLREAGPGDAFRVQRWLAATLEDYHPPGNWRRQYWRPPPVKPQ